MVEKSNVEGKYLIYTKKKKYQEYLAAPLLFANIVLAFRPYYFFFSHISNIRNINRGITFLSQEEAGPKNSLGSVYWTQTKPCTKIIEGTVCLFVCLW